MAVSGERIIARPTPTVACPQPVRYNAALTMSELPIGTLLGGRYHVLGTLGTGGMALVYHARDLNLQREVAIKILREDQTSNSSFQARFVHEARAAANLLHPNIVTVYDFGQDGARTFIAMEYVQGTDLKTLMRRRGRLPIEEAIGLVIQTCAGVGYAHRAGLVHCDLKPHNILVTTDGRAKITDFGIARALASIRPEEVSDVVWGSPQYFAPEQAAGGAPSPASDVYSLGIILYEVLTGSLPFQAPDATGLARLHQSVPPPHLAPSILRCRSRSSRSSSRFSRRNPQHAIGRRINWDACS